jgi:hypothetical protein
MISESELYKCAAYLDRLSKIKEDLITNDKKCHTVNNLIFLVSTIMEVVNECPNMASLAELNSIFKRCDIFISENSKGVY